MLYGRYQTGNSTDQHCGELPADAVSPLFEMALEATEEAVYNSLLRATTVESRFGKAEAIPIEKVREILARYRVGK